jgi:hypothetical protein
MRMDHLCFGSQNLLLHHQGKGSAIVTKGAFL